MLITITTARTIIPLVALLIFFFFSFRFVLQVASLVSLVYFKRPKEVQKGRLKLIEKY